MGYNKETIKIKHKNARIYKRVLATFNKLYDKNITNKNELIIFIVGLYLRELEPTQNTMWHLVHNRIDTEMTVEENQIQAEIYKKLTNTINKQSNLGG